MARLSDPDEQRRMLALSFEPQGDGFLYYHYRWSRGVPVSTAEREAYLRIPALGSRRTWRRSIEGRSTAPPRAYAPVQRKIFLAMPRSTAAAGGILGLGALGRAWLAPIIVEKVGYAVIGCAMLYLTVSIIAARISPRRDR